MSATDYWKKEKKYSHEFKTWVVRSDIYRYVKYKE